MGKILDGGGYTIWFLPIQNRFANGQISFYGDGDGHVNGARKAHRRHRVQKIGVQHQENLKGKNTR